MSNRGAVYFAWQDAFQKESLIFFQLLCKAILQLRQTANNVNHQTTAYAFTNIRHARDQIGPMREAGLDMVDRAPNSPIVAERRGYWLVPGEADKTAFEHECDQMELHFTELMTTLRITDQDNHSIAGMLQKDVTKVWEGFHLWFIDSTKLKDACTLGGVLVDIKGWKEIFK